LERDGNANPIIETQKGKASSANQFPFHNWYNFVLGYTPEFPEYVLEREKITTSDVVADPFVGTGTTLIACKQAAIPSIGIDANDFMVDAAQVKLGWDIDCVEFERCVQLILSEARLSIDQYNWEEAVLVAQLSLFEIGQRDYRELLSRRPAMLVDRYISDKPFVKAILIADIIETHLLNHPLKTLFDFALNAIVVPISNVRYGPGFGVIKPKDDMDVLSIFAEKLRRMLIDLKSVKPIQRDTLSAVVLGDSRCASQIFEPDSISLMITSPPYPGDHEYTKHTRLELIFRGYATNLKEFQQIKRRMIRASTTNIYIEDNDRQPISDVESIQILTAEIDKRLQEDGATSGFEKLYTKLVWEYFGGMYATFQECLIGLRPGGKIALLVSDSHAFKMVHIQTAKILAELGLRAGYVNPEILLWQHKTSTSHNYMLRENILILTKPT